MLFSRSPPRIAAPKLGHGDLISVDGRPVRLRVNARARRISLRLDAGRREVVATAPTLRALNDAAAFAQTRAAWIAQHLDELPDPIALRPGALFDVAGQPCRLERAAMRIPPRLIPATPLEPTRLLAYGADADSFQRAAIRALKGHALTLLTERSAVHAAALGYPTPPVALTDARGRWGSCRQAFQGRPAALRYNWRLVFAPIHVIDYVAAHECAHLAEANHGPRFWALVAELYGDHAKARSWLKRHGARLHAIGRA
jgi:predicted metal-dependent hydrolase